MASKEVTLLLHRAIVETTRYFKNGAADNKWREASLALGEANRSANGEFFLRYTLAGENAHLHIELSGEGPERDANRVFEITHKGVTATVARVGWQSSPLVKVMGQAILAGWVTGTWEIIVPEGRGEVVVTHIPDETTAPIDTVFPFDECLGWRFENE